MNISFFVLRPEATAKAMPATVQVAAQAQNFRLHGAGEKPSRMLRQHGPLDRSSDALVQVHVIRTIICFLKGHRTKGFISHPHPHPVSL